jgi:hypothetical protein
MVWHKSHLAPIDKIKQGKEYNVKRYKPFSDNSICGNTMFQQIGARYTPFSALHQFFHTLPIIWAEVAAKCFLRNPRWCLFKL